jgi:hypothetical protein
VSYYPEWSEARRCIQKVQENQVGLKQNGKHQLVAYADDVNLLGDNIGTIKKKTSKEVGLEINVKNSNYMLISHHQNVGKNRDIIIANIV